VTYYVSLLALLVAATVQAQAPKAPPSLDQLMSDLAAARQKKEDAGKAEATAKEAIEKHLKELHEKLGKLGIQACPPIVVPPPIKPPEVPPPAQKADPTQATGRLRFGTSGCTATVMYPRRPDGRWDILTAAHCTGGPGSKGSITMKDGRTINVTVAVREPGADISWLVTDNPVDSLPFAHLAVSNPSTGTKVWHTGYGVQVPGNREDGEIIGVTQEGQLSMYLSVSSGDSGSGIFRDDTGELVAVVCCTTRKGAKVVMYGGHCERAVQLRPKGVATSDTGVWEPMEIPIVTLVR
jgi:hypothetical protein